MPPEIDTQSAEGDIWSNARGLRFDAIREILISNDEVKKRTEIEDIVDYCLHDDTNLLPVLGGIELACALCAVSDTRIYGRELIKRFERFFQDNQVTTKLYYDRRSATMTLDDVEEYLKPVVNNIVHFISTIPHHIGLNESATPALDKVVGAGLHFLRQTDQPDVEQMVVIEKRQELFSQEFAQLGRLLETLAHVSQESLVTSSSAESMVAFYEVLDLLEGENYETVEITRPERVGSQIVLKTRSIKPLEGFQKYIDRRTGRFRSSKRHSLKDVMSQVRNPANFTTYALDFIANSPSGDRIWADINKSIFLSPPIFDESITDNTFFRRKELNQRIFEFQLFLSDQIIKLATDPVNVDPKTKESILQAIDSQVFTNQIFLAKTVVHAATHQHWIAEVLNADEPLPQQRVITLGEDINQRYAALKGQWPEMRKKLITSLGALEPKAYQVRHFIKALDIAFDPDQLIDSPIASTTPDAVDMQAHADWPSSIYYTTNRPKGFSSAIGIRSQAQPAREPQPRQTEKAGVSIETMSVQAAKGDAFEQLAGCALALIDENIDIPLIPQLAINRKYSATGEVRQASRRIDFADPTGRRVYEIKWGNAIAGIRDNLERDAQRLDTDEIDEYILVRFKSDQERKLGDLPHPKMREVSFEEIGTQIADTELRSAIFSISSFLIGTSENPGENPDAHEILDTIKDVLFSISEESRSLPAEAKRASMKKSLVAVQKFVQQYKYFGMSLKDWQDRMHEFINEHYSPLTMHVPVVLEDGTRTIYRTKIPPIKLMGEEPRRYRTLWKFGDLTFSSKRARDAAIAIEMAGFRINDCILSKPEDGSAIDDAIFTIRGERYTTSDTIRANESTIKGVYSSVAFARKLGATPEDITFMQQYIQETGANA